MRGSGFALAVTFAGLLGCGSRTGLLVGDPLPVEDAGVTPPEDADVEDVGLAPPVDASLPSACADAGITTIYAITQSNVLVAFDPPSSTFRFVGTIDCPTTQSPFSMAVDRAGTPTAIFADGSLYRLGIHQGGVTCTQVGFVPQQNNLPSQFGMGFAADNQGGGETLYVATDQVPPVLGTLDLTTYAVHPIGAIHGQALWFPELTGTGAGDLYAFAGDECTLKPGCTGEPVDCYTCPSSRVARLDKTSGAVLASVPLKGMAPGGGWAVAYWGGSLYIFTAPNGGGSIVTRFDLATEIHGTVASYPEIIVGAGVSTCAPLVTP